MVRVLIAGLVAMVLAIVIGPSFIEWARQNYRVVLGFDHWTLSKSPDENAELLANQLRAFDADLMTGGRVDLVTHSRGGLVGRVGKGQALGFLMAIFQKIAASSFAYSALSRASAHCRRNEYR